MEDTYDGIRGGILPLSWSLTFWSLWDWDLLYYWPHYCQLPSSLSKSATKEIKPRPGIDDQSDLCSYKTNTIVTAVNLQPYWNLNFLSAIDNGFYWSIVFCILSLWNTRYIDLGNATEWRKQLIPRQLLYQLISSLMWTGYSCFPLKFSLTQCGVFFCC